MDTQQSAMTFQFDGGQVGYVAEALRPSQCERQTGKEEGRCVLAT